MFPLSVLIVQLWKSFMEEREESPFSVLSLVLGYSS